MAELNVCMDCGQSDEETAPGTKWVQCDSCTAWVHDLCAGVDDSIKETVWICSRCAPSTELLAGSESRPTEKSEHKDVPVRASQSVAEPVKKDWSAPELTDRQFEEKQAARERAFYRQMEVRMERWMRELKVEAQKGLEALKEAQRPRTSEHREKYGQRSRSPLEKPSRVECSSESGNELESSAKSYSNDRPLLLTEEQIATRKVISKSLPKFNGDPEAWPIFISSYEHTTKACGFSNIKNLDRLINSLEGEALNAVRSMLILPASVPEVIRDLRKLFGQPERLLRTMMVKVERAIAPSTSDLQSFVRFGITVKQLCQHLEASGLQDHLNNPLLVQQLVGKLPADYQMKWVEWRRQRKGTPLRLFTDYINEIGDIASEAVTYESPQTKEPARGRTAPKREFIHVHESTQRNDEVKSRRACWVCKRTDHRIRQCDDFRKLTVVERLETVRRANLCEKCLNRHGDNPCELQRPCTIRSCGGDHHFLLHRVEESVLLQQVEYNNSLQTSTIFRMIPVTLHAGGKRFDTLAFLDEGSSTTLLDEEVADYLEMQGEVEPLIVTWTGNINRTENGSRKVNVKISARHSDTQIQLERVRTVTQLMLPKQDIHFKEVAEQYPHLKGLPVKDRIGEKASILIGLDNLHALAPLESRIGDDNEPIAVRSQLGWTVYGPGPKTRHASTYLYLHQGRTVSNEQLHELLRDQYSLNEVGVNSYAIPESEEVRRAKELLEATTIRVDGRYQTGLLWRRDERRFPDSYPMALRRMKALERRLERNFPLRTKVNLLIEEYEAKGYAHKITKDELSGTAAAAVWYLPLNVVLNPKKPDKVRLVWDAAAAVGGISLNSELLTGPDMLVSLPKVICGFRERPVAFGGDIQEMYHQIRITAADKQALRFNFRANPSENPQIYVMDVATFGATCSPCSAQYVKNLNVGEFVERYPEAVMAIVNKHYVDDYYDSTDTVEEAIQRAREVKLIHAHGGFHIRNWLSNSETFLTEFGTQKSSDTVIFGPEKMAGCERVLGIAWGPLQDEFSFGSVSRAEFDEMREQKRYPTKRDVLRIVMEQFDPIGLITPVTVRGKMLIQDLWRTGCDWHDAIDEVSQRKWLRWLVLMDNIKNFKVPRSYFGYATSSQIKELQLHVFTDASETAYGCVAYFRALVQGEIRCALVMSRSKVAPLKQLSIPRLELLAAVLGARLAKSVQMSHSYEIGKVVMWTDANVVLSWISSDQRRYKQFVGLRIGEILNLTRVTDWRWVPTHDNVADQLTKWGKDPEMHPESAWVRGPAFLYEEEGRWPQKEMPPPHTTEELRVHLLWHDATVQPPEIDVDRFSKWTVLVRTIASAYRFASNCRRKIQGLPLEVLKVAFRPKAFFKTSELAFNANRLRSVKTAL